MPPVSQISVIPESHVIRSESKSSSATLSFRIDVKGREFVSFSDDDSKLEWKISRSHESLTGFMIHINEWCKEYAVNVTLMIPTVQVGDAAMSKPHLEILELLCLQFLMEKDGAAMTGCSWQISTDSVDDLLSSGSASIPGSSFQELEIIPETTCVKLDSVGQFQKFLRRLQQCAAVDTTVFVRFVIFKQAIILHVIFGGLESSIASMSVIPAARSAKKSGNPFYGNFSVTQRCLLPLLGGNSKPFILINPGQIAEKRAVLYQALLDLCERICLTALTCHAEDPSSMRLDECEVVGSVDLLPLRAGVKQKIAERTDTPVHVLKVVAEEEDLKEGVAQLDAELEEVRRSSIMANDSYDASENELNELKTRNLILRAEIDRLKITSSITGSGNAYTNHLLSEVKQLRAELAAVEGERRKYLTSKRLVESLIEKSNKSKSEALLKQSKLDEAKKTEEIMRKELIEMKRNCESLLEMNRKLERELEVVKRASLAEPSVPCVESVYHQFLFPYQRKREMEKTFLSLYDSLGKIERAVAVNCPSVLLDVKRSSDSMHRLKDCVNELLAASEKLEISAVTLLKKSSSEKQKKVPAH